MYQTLDRLFGLSKNGTTVKKEFLAAIATFLSMIYIIFVNPAILKNTGMPQDALVTGTIVTIIVGTLLAGIIGKAPLALAPGMGLNVFFTYTLVLSHHLSWNEALGIIFISGSVFFILSLLGFQKTIINNLPISIKVGISGGLGLFLTLIGLSNMGVIGANESTLVQLNSLTQTSSVALIGLAIIIVLAVRKVTGFIVIGIILTTIVAILFGLVSMPESLVTMPPSMAPIFAKISLPSVFSISILASIFSLMFVALFDSVSTIAVVTEKMQFESQEAKNKALARMLKVDSGNSALGAFFGSSTAITYMESMVGIEAGGKTGLTSIFIALLFFLSLFFAPVVMMVPLYVTAPALIVVGVLMFQNFKLIDISNFKDVLVAFITSIMMPLTYNIGYGLAFGFLAYTLVEIASGNIKKIHWVIWLVTILSLMEIFTI